MRILRHLPIEGTRAGELYGLGFCSAGVLTRDGYAAGGSHATTPDRLSLVEKFKLRQCQIFLLVA